MAALFSLKLNVAFVIVSFAILTLCEGVSYQCPKVCTCLIPMVDCSKRGLEKIPHDVPVWVQSLSLKGNGLKNIPEDAFRGLTNLTSLDLSENELTTLNGSSLRHLPNLTELKLAKNELEEIPLFNHGRLQQLILTHNKIDDINPDAIASLPKLQLLDLSYNKLSAILRGMFPHHTHLLHLTVNNNKISDIEVGALGNLTALESLKMNKNKIQTVKQRVFDMISLKHLEMNRNRVSKIDGLSFKDLRNLTTLKLRRNYINEPSDGAFYGLGKIKTLQLDYNNITSLKKGWLYGLTSLEQLSLSHNRINKIESDCWEFLELLWQLDMDHNDVSNIDKDTFRKLKLLQNLFLNHNKVMNIGNDSFEGLNALQILELNNNKLSWSRDDMSGAFHGLNNLNRLAMDSNHIHSISKRAFHDLTKLQTLHFTNNAISSIENSAFSTLTLLQDLKFNTTHLLCDCHLQWLPKWLKDHKFDKSVNAHCAHPEPLKGRSIFDVQEHEFKCGGVSTPEFVESPAGKLIALRNGNLSLTCSATSSSDTPMTAEWNKDGEIVSNKLVENKSSMQNAEMVKMTTTLHLKNIQDSDGGIYQCVISNGLGSDMSPGAVVSVCELPRFTKKPNPVTVRAGTKEARLECAATGHPTPQIAWQKDGGTGFPAARERRMKVVPDDDNFFIVDVKIIDQGVYTCTASNDAGTVTVNATLNVLETPALTDKMVDIEVQSGEDTVLKCKARGSPKPKVTWLKDGEELVATPRHFFTAENQILLIMETKQSDSGEYTCQMQNTLGTERGSSYLTVIGEDGASAGHLGGVFEDGSTTTGIVIIAVVCCVVGTSLIWVLIIYKTRRRSEEYSSTPTDDTTLPGDGMYRGSTKALTQNGTTTIHNFLHGHNNYTNAKLPLNGYGSNSSKMRMPVYQSDSGLHIEEDEESQTMPLTTERPPDAHSMTASRRHLFGGSVRSVRGSTHSVVGPRSARNSCLLQTFNPHTASQQTLAGRHGSECTLGHSNPGASSIMCSQKYHPNMEESTALHEHVFHSSRPPDGQGHHHHHPCENGYHHHHPTFHPSHPAQYQPPYVDTSHQPPPLPPKHARLSKDYSPSTSSDGARNSYTPSTSNTEISPSLSLPSSVHSTRVNPCHSSSSTDVSSTASSSASEEESKVTNNNDCVVITSNPLGTTCSQETRTLENGLDVRLPNRTCPT